VKIIVNGETVTLEKSLNITDFLGAVKSDQPEYVTVQKNGEILSRADFEKIFVEDGDEIEFLYFMGGGAND
jgi:sulfur carrier protein